jgi:hypothetical protein
MDFIVSLLPLLLVVPLIVFWFVMISHAIKNNIPNKQYWLIILILGSVMGAIVYYFMIYKDMQ